MSHNPPLVSTGSTNDLPLVELVETLWVEPVETVGQSLSPGFDKLNQRSSAG